MVDSVANGNTSELHDMTGGQDVWWYAGFVAVCYVLPVVCVMGVSLNVMSIGVFAGVGQLTHRQTPAQVLLIGLCCFDMIQLLLSAILLPMQYVPDEYQQVHHVANYMLVIFAPVLLTANCASIWAMVAITLQRYRAVCQPLRLPGHQSQALRQAHVAVLCVVLLAALITLPTYLRLTLEPNAKLQGHYMQAAPTELSYQHWFHTLDRALFVIGFYALPCLIITSLNVLIVRSIRAARRDNLLAQSLPSVHKDQELRAVRVVAAIVALFFICHSLNLYIGLSWWIHPSTFWRDRLAWLLNDINNLLINLNSSLNPCCFLFFTKRFRDRFWDHFGGRTSMVNLRVVRLSAATIDNGVRRSSPSMPASVSSRRSTDADAKPHFWLQSRSPSRERALSCV